MAEWFPSYSEKLLPPSPLGMAIDWTNPLTDGLIAAYIPGYGMQDLSGYAGYLTSGPVNSWSANSEGPSLTIPSASTTAAGGGYYSIPAGSPLLLGGGKMTIYWRGIFTGFNASAAVTLGIQANNTYANPYFMLAMQVNAATTWYPAWNSAGTFTNGTTVTFPATVATVPVSMAVTANVAGSVIPYQNAVAQTSTTFGSAPTAGTGPLVQIGGLYNGAFYSHGMQVNAAFIWSRVLPAADITALDQAPYSFLIASEGEEQAMFTGLVAACRVNPLLRR